MRPDEPPPRKRLRRRENPHAVRFITFSCVGRRPLLGHPGVRDLFVSTLARARAARGFQLFAWVVMPEHVHLLLRPAPGDTYERISTSLKSGVARTVLARWRELDAPVLRSLVQADGSLRFWQHGGGFDRTIRNAEEFAKTVRYIHLNPVERGLVGKPDEWRWSSVRWWWGLRDGEAECDPASLYDPRTWWEGWTGFA